MTTWYLFSDWLPQSAVTWATMIQCGRFYCVYGTCSVTGCLTLPWLELPWYSVAGYLVSMAPVQWLVTWLSHDLSYHDTVWQVSMVPVQWLVTSPCCDLSYHDIVSMVIVQWLVTWLSHDLSYYDTVWQVILCDNDKIFQPPAICVFIESTTDPSRRQESIISVDTIFESHSKWHVLWQWQTSH